MKNGFLIAVSAVFLALQMGCATKCYEMPAACDLTPDPGPCEALIPKYYYDKESGKCKEFDWGGCGGTVPFDSMEECKACLGK